MLKIEISGHLYMLQVGGEIIDGSPLNTLVHCSDLWTSTDLSNPCFPWCRTVIIECRWKYAL